MRLAVFATLYQSLKKMRLVLAEGASLAEVQAVFEYEGIIMSHPVKEEDTHFPKLPAPQAGLANFKPDSGGIQEYLTTLAEQTATAILNWPRLQETLVSSKRQVGPQRSTASATRAWIALEGKPAIDRCNGDRIVAIAERSPKWLSQILVDLGILRSKLISDQLVASDFNNETFNVLKKEVRASPVGAFFGILNDMSKSARSSLDVQHYHKAQRFHAEVVETVLSSGQAADPEKVKYCRAAVNFAIDILCSAPNLSVAFSSDCCDESGKSTERTLLQQALQERNVTVVKYASQPPSGSSRPLTLPGWNEAQPTTFLLLDFSKLL